MRAFTGIGTNGQAGANAVEDNFEVCGSGNVESGRLFGWEGSGLGGGVVQIGPSHCKIRRIGKRIVISRAADRIPKLTTKLGFPFNRLDDVGWPANAVLCPVQNAALISARRRHSRTCLRLFRAMSVNIPANRRAADQLQVLPPNQQISALAEAKNRNRRTAGKAGRRNAPSGTAIVTRPAAPTIRLHALSTTLPGARMKAPSGPPCRIGTMTFGHPPSRRHAGPLCPES
jgi:hypothetical protein